MRETIARLLAEANSPKQADAFKAYFQSDEDLHQVSLIGKEILANLPFKPGACAHLTAYWVMLIRERLKLPAQGVVGHLAINGTLVFGKIGNDLSSALQGASLAWDGHCWLALGDQIGEISAFRTAYSSKSPPLLKTTILRQFGEGCGALLATPTQWLETELEYRPKRVLTDDEIEGLAHGTKQFYGF